MSKEKWILSAQDQELARQLAQELGLSELVAQILINRGVTTAEAGREFLDCELEKIPEPLLMLGMEKAVQRVEEALARHEGIVVYGDYDADGQTATALLVSVLRKLAPNPSLISYYLPHRLDEGYGVHKAALERLQGRASLVITVDCGISAAKEVSFAKKLGLEMIITDHHEPDKILPAAVAVLNPKQAGCPYPHKDLAGVGVAFKLVQALGLPAAEQSKYLDLVALGTVADLVSLKGENRVYVRHGLQQMAQTENIGLKMLLETAEVQTPTAGDLGFRLGPRLNAAGRLGDPSRGVELLLTEDEVTARRLALELQRENSKRQDLEDVVFNEALALVEKYRLFEEAAIVVWKEGWHPGVVGIVASRLLEQFYRPTIVISLQGGEGTGSARSIPGLHLYESLLFCQGFLKRFGGHALAAGLTIALENLHPFQECFQQFAAQNLQPEDFIPKLAIDAQGTLSQITKEFIEELALLEPHGIGNPGPTLKVDAACVRSRAVGQENRHLQLFLQDETAQEVAAIAFGRGQEEEALQRQAENVSLAFVPRINDWGGRQTVQLQIKAWQEGPRSGTYVEKWLIDNYPWKLPAPYYLSKALGREETKEEEKLPINGLDLRGAWNKAEALRKRGDFRERTLILVNTPREVLQVTRELRILIPGATDFVAFEHEWLTEQEQQELAKLAPPWLVSTGYGLEGKWPVVWFWKPPLNEGNFTTWRNLVEGKGQLVLAYGPRDQRQAQLALKQIYPRRQGLARVYSQLRMEGATVSYNVAQTQLEKLGLLPALPFAIGVFSELGLWKVEDGHILYQPPPSRKLDLQQTVLYNKGTIIREQSFEYLKHCLERGFFQDGLKREN